MRYQLIIQAEASHAHAPIQNLLIVPTSAIVSLLEMFHVNLGLFGNSQAFPRGMMNFGFLLKQLSKANKTWTGSSGYIFLSIQESDKG